MCDTHKLYIWGNQNSEVSARQINNGMNIYNYYKYL